MNKKLGLTRSRASLLPILGCPWCVVQLSLSQRTPEGESGSTRSLKDRQLWQTRQPSITVFSSILDYQTIFSRFSITEYDTAALLEAVEISDG